MRLTILAAVFTMLCMPALAAQDDPQLDDLFKALAEARTPDVARPIEVQIVTIWAQSGSPTTELLYGRAAQSLDRSDLDTAGALLDAITQIDPDFAAAWVLRANLHMLKRESEPAIADLEKALKLEPRHFAALVSLGQLMEASGNQKAALKAYDAALKLDPAMPDVRSHAEALRKKLQGDPI